MPFSALPDELQSRVVEFTVMKNELIPIDNVPTNARLKVHPFQNSGKLLRLSYEYFLSTNVIECPTVLYDIWHDQILPFAHWASTVDVTVLSRARNIQFRFEMSDACTTAEGQNCVEYIQHQFIPNVVPMIPRVRSIHALFDFTAENRRHWAADDWDVSDHAQKLVAPTLMALQKAKLPVKMIARQKCHWGCPVSEYTIELPLTTSKAEEYAKLLAADYMKDAAKDRKREMDSAKEVDQEMTDAEID